MCYITFHFRINLDLKILNIGADECVCVWIFTNRIIWTGDHQGLGVDRLCFWFIGNNNRKIKIFPVFFFFFLADTDLVFIFLKFFCFLILKWQIQFICIIVVNYGNSMNWYRRSKCTKRLYINDNNNKNKKRRHGNENKYKK